MQKVAGDQSSFSGILQFMILNSKCGRSNWQRVNSMYGGCVLTSADQRLIPTCFLVICQHNNMYFRGYLRTSQAVFMATKPGNLHQNTIFS